ncbi:MAG: twin-arginine translocase subunit TatC [Alphaproteobacteria bacterium]|nr:twin-arginine translocase subunit TatC [Alphaproteobacteria bacterium]
MSPNDAVPEMRETPLIEHLIELRRRLIIVLLAFFAATALAYTFAPQIYAFLVQPLADSFPDPANRRMIYTGLTEAFFTYLKLAVFAGFFLSFPVIASQAYAFLAPGLYKQERRAAVPYLVAAPILFFAGAALCYYGIFPAAWRFFLSFETASAGGMPIRLEARVSEYLGLVIHLLLAFGISFQLPVVLALLTQAGMIQAKTLARGRRYAVVIIVVVAAFITPPDIFSQVALSVPLYLLYEGSVWICRAIERRREHARHQMDTPESGAV